MPLVKVQFSLPVLPNYLRLVRPVDSGWSWSSTGIDVADVSDEELRAIGKEWTEALIAHARRRRANR